MTKAEAYVLALSRTNQMWQELTPAERAEADIGVRWLKLTDNDPSLPKRGRPQGSRNRKKAAEIVAQSAEA